MNTTNYIMPLEVRQHYTRFYTNSTSCDFVGYINHLEAAIYREVIYGRDYYYDTFYFRNNDKAELKQLRDAVKMYEQAGYRVSEDFAKVLNGVNYTFTISWGE